MCSSPKGGTTKPLLSSNVDSSSGDMSAVEYSDMVHRANESYERRQEELIEYREIHKRATTGKKQEGASFLEKLKVFLDQNRPSRQLESK